MSRDVHIYVLCDPTTKHVRYVGKSSDVKTRCRGHAKSYGPCGDWVRDLISRGTPPVVLIVCTLSLQRPGYIGWNGYAFDVAASAAERAIIDHFQLGTPGELFNRAGMPEKPKPEYAAGRQAELPHGVAVEVWPSPIAAPSAGATAHDWADGTALVEDQQ